MSSLLTFSDLTDRRGVTGSNPARLITNFYMHLPIEPKFKIQAEIWFLIQHDVKYLTVLGPQVRILSLDLGTKVVVENLRTSLFTNCVG